jgi:hypothetical protein
MRFEEAYGGSKERRFRDAATQLVCPDSGQVDEPLSPPRVTKRCRKRGKGNSSTVPWGIGWRIAKQNLTFSR